MAAPVTSDLIPHAEDGFLVAPAGTPVKVAKDEMGPRARWVIPAAIVVLSLLTFTQLAALWPAVLSAQPDVTATGGGGQTTTVTTPEAVGPPMLFGLWQPALDPELAVLVMVLLAGLLGGLVGAGRKFQHWAQRQQLTKRDEWSYALLPVQGAMLAVIIYFTLRGGFLGNGVPAPINPFGIAAIAALVGLFTDNAMHRLRQVMDALLGQPGQPAVEDAPASNGNGGGPTNGHADGQIGKTTKAKAKPKPAPNVIPAPAVRRGQSTRRPATGGSGRR